MYQCVSENIYMKIYKNEERNWESFGCVSALGKLHLGNVCILRNTIFPIFNTLPLLTITFFCMVVKQFVIGVRPPPPLLEYYVICEHSLIILSGIQWISRKIIIHVVIKDDKIEEIWNYDSFLGWLSFKDWA